MTPQRIQLRRERGWRIPPHTIKVDRSSRWGNPFPAADYGQERAVQLFEEFLGGDRRYVKDGVATTYPPDREIRRWLRGWNLGCWCTADEPCHADALLTIANRKE